MGRWRLFAALPLLLGCIACSGGGGAPADRFSAREISYADLTDWAGEDHAKALEVFTASCPILAAHPKPPTAVSRITVDGHLWKSLCDEARGVPARNGEAARQYFEKRFTPYRISNNGSDKGLFTGYYEPVLYGSRVKTGHFIYPLYAPPPELKTKKPYLTHAQIAAGALKNRHLEIAWVDDPVMLFFLQIQGSGRVRFADGREMLVGYADQNGYPYSSLGKIMGDEGYLPKDQINFFTIRQWLYAHPAEAMPLMQRNPSYVFFKPMDRAGAVGAVGNVLTPQRSLAVDSNFIPYGLPLYMETELPALAGGRPVTFRRMLVAQDTGGAIRGPVRGDIFFGPGNDAEYLAGFMKGKGVYSLLVPREITGQLR